MRFLRGCTFFNLGGKRMIKKFFLHALFYDKRQVNVTAIEIAMHYGVTISKAREFIEHDLKTGMVMKHPTTSGYSLTFEGLRGLVQQLSQ